MMLFCWADKLNGKERKIRRFFRGFLSFHFHSREGGDFYSMLFMASALATANLERLPDAVMCTVLDVKSVW